MRLVTIVSSIGLFGCSGGSTEPPPPPAPPAAELGCGATTDVSLAAGEARVLSIGAGTDCIRLRAESQSAEYLIVAASAATDVVLGGVTAAFRLMGRSALAATAALRAVPPSRAGPADQSERFHAMLRERERVAALAPRRRPPAARTAGVHPVVGDGRTFNACESIACEEFAAVPAHAVYVGTSVALFADDSIPSNGYTQAELEYYGRLFDRYLYPTDTTAFGRESDVDGNGLVIALITRAVNRLTPICNGGLIAGYFVGTDLLPGEPGSNDGEVLYTIAPDPNGEAGCKVTKDFASRALGPLLIHEFQHMISYNQHVLLRHGPAEQSWLNEGLSHFAEELGGRRTPDDWCVLNDCLSIFTVPILTNAYRYLLAPDDYFLIYPEGSTGNLGERGASWLFLRWLADHFGTDWTFTRGLEQTAAVGAANVSAVVNVPFATLVGEWHLANWLDHLGGFTPSSALLRYTSWNFRQTFASFHAQDRRTYPLDFPLVPDSVRGALDQSGTLHGGSGHYLRIIVDPTASPYDVRLSGPAGAALAVTANGRLAVARVK